MATLTVTKEWLLHEANNIEKSANDSLRAWILLGQEKRFGEEMAKVHKLRALAELKSIAARREGLRELGYPRSAAI